MSQTFDDFELIIVNDGSTDNTENIVSELMQKYPKIRYLSQNNAGVCVSRNVALDHARGRYIAIIDADDLWVPDKLSRQMDVLAGDEDVFVLTGNRIFYGDGEDREFGTVTMPPDVVNEKYDTSNILKVDLYQMVLINTALVGRDAVRSLGGWSPDKWTAEDWDLWVRASNKYRFRTIQEPLVLYRKHKKSLTSGQDFFKVSQAHEEIIYESFFSGAISRSELSNILLKRRVEACGIFVYQKEFLKSLVMLAKAFRLLRCWVDKKAWIKVKDVVFLAFKKITGDV